MVPEASEALTRLTTMVGKTFGQRAIAEDSSMPL